MDIQNYNSLAWDRQVEKGDQWTQAVDAETIENARRGVWEVVLTPTKNVPKDWFPADLNGIDLLCLASGGGQQAPLFAAAGANVTSFDNSARQLAQDKFVAERDNLKITLEKGDTADLSRFTDESFDFIFHPCSNCFMPKLAPIWRESFRVLRHGGALISGFNNPITFIFDQKLEEEKEVLQVRYSLPFSDVESLDKNELEEKISQNTPLEFGHTLEEQIGGQIGAGFVITGFYEDYWAKETDSLLNKFTPQFIATKADKL